MARRSSKPRLVLYDSLLLLIRIAKMSESEQRDVSLLKNALRDLDSSTRNDELHREYWESPTFRRLRSKIRRDKVLLNYLRRFAPTKKQGRKLWLLDKSSSISTMLATSAFPRIVFDKLRPRLEDIAHLLVRERITLKRLTKQFKDGAATLARVPSPIVALLTDPRELRRRLELAWHELLSMQRGVRVFQAAIALYSTSLLSGLFTYSTLKALKTSGMGTLRQNLELLAHFHGMLFHENLSLEAIRRQRERWPVQAKKLSPILKSAH